MRLIDLKRATLEVIINSLGPFGRPRMHHTRRWYLSTCGARPRESTDRLRENSILCRINEPPAGSCDIYAPLSGWIGNCMYVAAPVARDHTVTRSCKWVLGLPGRVREYSTTYAPLGEAKDRSTVGRPLDPSETFCTSFNARVPVLISDFEDRDQATLCTSAEHELRIKGPADMSDRRVHQPCAGDVEGIDAAYDQSILDGSQDKVATITKRGERARLFVQLCKVHDARRRIDGHQRSTTGTNLRRHLGIRTLFDELG